MIARYTRPAMGRIWDDTNKFSIWLEIELLACEAQAALGVIPQEAVREMRAKAAFDVARIDEIEREVKHDVIAFLTNVGEYVGPAARFIHLGMTSSDVLDTCLAVQMKQSAELLLDGLNKLAEVLARRAREFKHTIMVGRTHGIHAEPTTFGLKLALWYDETRRNIARLQAARERIAVGKISGAVGTFEHLSPKVEEYVCEKLGLKPAPVSTQILQRDRHAEFLATLAVIGSSLEKFATEIRHLQKTEVLEAEEFFSKGQKGSSAMPHKRNPITCERIAGLARVLRGNALAAMENVALWHERDITHSSVERIVIPDSCILLDYMLALMTDVIDRLLVYPDNMMKNLQRTHGLIFSQSVLLALTRKQMKREDA
ncbi:MAG TPA: adenylosuccinate lyase, partial [Bacteroidota bacterium]|nr:adenylosuccinate lyase [Bacteroidota bacterium]